MPKTAQEQQFDGLVEIVWQHFRILGYKKSGNNFRFYSGQEKFGKIVNFQKSQYGQRDAIHFTVNIGIYIPDYDLHFSGKFSTEKFRECECSIRDRIGWIIKAGRDVWYDLDGETDVLGLQKELEDAFEAYVIPYLGKFQSREGVLLHLFERGIGDNAIAPIPLIKTLHYNGYRREAQFVLGQKYKTGDDQYKNELLELNNALL